LNIFDSVSVGVMIFDEKGLIKYQNGIARDISKQVDIARLVDVKNIIRQNSLSCLTLKNGLYNTLLSVPVRENGNFKEVITLVYQDEDKHKCAVRVSDLDTLNKEIENIMESYFDGFWITDGEGKVLRVDSASEKINGLKPEQIIGRYVKDLVAEGFYSHSAILEVIKNRKPCTVTCTTRLGKITELIGVPIFDSEGNLWRIISNIKDLTELYNSKQKLREASAKEELYKKEIEYLRDQLMGDEEYVVTNGEMKKIFTFVHKLSKVDATVLIKGETGTGKDVIASMLHKLGLRSKGPFIKINCGAIPENLFESEFFGYEKGAFTGASNTGKMGLLELANGGTVFLDEISELPAQSQAKLLQVIQDRKIIRIGGTKPVQLDIRVIAATNRDLEEMVAEKLFRQDLFYRLNVVNIDVPPLRHRRDEIPELILHFMKVFNNKYKFSKTISHSVLSHLANHNWPGNVREVENFVERLILTVNEDHIDTGHLPPALLNTEALPIIDHSFHVSEGKSLKEVLEEIERGILVETIKKHGSTRKVAKALKISQGNVVRKAQKYGIKLGLGVF